MSLTVKLEKVYKRMKDEEANARSLAEQVAMAVRGTTETQSLILSKEALVECVCEVRFRQTKQERLLNRANCMQTSFAERRATILDNNASLLSIDDHKNEEKQRFVRKTNESVTFSLGEPLRVGETLEVVCFKKEHFRKKFMGAYTMILDSMRNGQDLILIDEFLTQPKRGSFLEERVQFTLKYSEPIVEIGTGRVLEQGLRKKKSMANCLDVTDDVRNLEELDFMSKHHQQQQQQKLSLSSTTLPPIFSDRDRSNTNATGSVGSEVKSESDKSSANLKDAIGKATLTLAQLAFNPNLIINKSGGAGPSCPPNHAKKKCRVHIQETFEASHPELSILEGFKFDKYADGKKCLVPHLLTKNLNNKVTTWQVRVNLIELRHIIGNNERVYCMVEIGDQRFYSSVKSIERLKFNEVFTARYENVRSQRLFNFLIKISVYYKYFIRADTLIGSFEIDFGTVYKQPTNEFHHKWGAIMPKDDSASQISGNSGGGGGGDFSVATTPKGYVKLDIIVLSKGDKAQIHKEEIEKDDDIDK